MAVSDDSYLREFTARITSAQEKIASRWIQQHSIQLEAGNPADHGLLSTDGQQWAVAKVRKDGNEIWHEVEGEPPAVGTVVTGAIAFDNRTALMHTHTALHMLAGVIWRNYGAQVTGGDVSRCAPAWISNTRACAGNSSRRSNRK